MVFNPAWVGVAAGLMSSIRPKKKAKLNTDVEATADVIKSTEPGAMDHPGVHSQIKENEKRKRAMDEALDY